MKLEARWVNRTAILLLALVSIWVIVTSTIYRFLNPEQTETELFLHLLDAVRLNF